MRDHDGTELNIGDRVTNAESKMISGDAGGRRIISFPSSTCVEIEQADRWSPVFLACLLRKVG